MEDLGFVQAGSVDVVVIPRTGVRVLPFGHPGAI